MIAINYTLPSSMHAVVNDTMTIRNPAQYDAMDDVDPNTYDWSSVTHNTWFLCVNKQQGKGYYIPMCEEENQAPGHVCKRTVEPYARAKCCMLTFLAKEGWRVVQIQH